MYSKRKALSIVAVIALAIAAVPFAASAAPAAQDLQAPVVSAVAGAPNPAGLGDLVTVTAVVDDAATGGSNIAEARFNVNGGAFAALAASDGAFDEPTEDVTGSFTVETLGTLEICVLGSDAAGLVSETVCADVTAADTEAPVVTAVAASPNPAPTGTQVTITATVDDAATGGSNIASAEFSVNGGAFAPLAASDGAFDEPTEDVTGSQSFSTVGTYQICVQGTDAAGNVATPVCADLTIESKIAFDGFQPPIKGQEKFVKAGRTIPVKWALFDPEGSPISLLETFQGIFSYEVDCETLEGDPELAVMEKSPGNAAVRSLLSGEWIALWKTPKEYADSCRMMYVLFNDGSTSPEVLFRFR